MLSVVSTHLPSAAHVYLLLGQGCLSSSVSSFTISVMTKRMWVRSWGVKVEDREGETQKAILGGDAGE